MALPKKEWPVRGVQLDLRAGNLDLNRAQVVWETGGQEPAFERVYDWIPGAAGVAWLEVEAQRPDGRRAHAVASCRVKGPR